MARNGNWVVAPLFRTDQLTTGPFQLTFSIYVTGCPSGVLIRSSLL